MVTEGKYSTFSETGEVVERVNFETFVKLYVNHRPVFAVGPAQIVQAFDAMKRHEEGSLMREVLLDLLTKQGEQMSREEIEECLSKLVGEGALEDLLPAEIPAYEFATQTLGLAELEEVESADPGG